MLDQVKAIVENGVKVEVRDQNQYSQYPVIVTDVAPESITNGWFLTYYPRLITKGNPRLYDGKEAFSSLTITHFKRLYDRLMEIDARFASGEGVTVGANNQRTATYEFPGKARFHVRQFNDSVTISLSITDPASPFHMLAINFRIVNSKKEQGKRHLIGSESQWDLNTDSFVEHNAILSPKKKRYLQVFQEDQNTIPYVKAPSRPGMNGTTQVDPNNSEFLYLMDIDNAYRALAFIYEQTILEHAMAVALPLVQAKQAPASNAFGAPATGGFDGQHAFGAPAQTGFGFPAAGFGDQAASFQNQAFGVQAQAPANNQSQNGFVKEPVMQSSNPFMQKVNWGDNDRVF
jgi:hypothetical protein